MASLRDTLRAPIALPANRPARFYRGGQLLGAFRGEPGAEDGDRPEDWVGSATRTWRPAAAPPLDDGLTTVELAGERHTLEGILAREPEAVIGPELLAVAGPTLGLLVKLLDAGERLPVHAHPTRQAAAAHLGSRFGKTEAWIVLATRDGQQGRVWAGFREDVAADTLRAWIETHSSAAMLGALVEMPVHAGDAILVPGGVPHAIGSGVFLLELQEPTDFSVVAETRGFPIDPEAATLGLGWGVALELIDRSAIGDNRQTPVPVGPHVTRLLGPAADPYFRALRLAVDGPMAWPAPGSFAVGAVLAGTGQLRAGRGTLGLGRGTTFALPAIASDDAELSGAALDIIVCLSPDPEHLRPALPPGPRST